MPDSLLKLSHKNLNLVVDAGYGGHVREFSLEGNNALAENTPAFGSTYWPSPQSAWGWPPLPALDNSSYSVLNYNSIIEIQSRVCTQTMLQLTKRFFFLGDVLRVEYDLKNCAERTVRYAPWEITRLRGGLTFYKSDDDILEHSTASVERLEGCLWHTYQPENQKENQKLFGNNSHGWLANVSRELLLIKHFNRVPSELIAPGEAEVEIYAHGDFENAYIEMEQQGEYSEINPGHTLAWSVDWELLRVPVGLSIDVGSKELVQFVELKR